VKRLLLALPFLLISFMSSADDGKLKLFPIWELKQCPTETFACYDFETSKQILKIDLELQLKLEKCDVCEQNKADLLLAVDKLKLASAEDAKIIDGLNIRLTEKQTKLEETTLELKKAEEHTVWKYLPWFITGAAVLTAGGFVAGWYLSTR